MDERPSYWSVIPAGVRYDDRLPANAKLLYGEVSALICEEGYCYASNAYFAQLYGVADETVSRLFAKLEACGHIRREVEKDKNGQVVRRKIWLNVSAYDGHPLDEIVNTSPQKNQCPIDEKVKETNTSITSKRENKKRKAAAVPPLTESELRERTVGWIGSTLDGASREEKNAVFFAIMNFYEPRDKTPSRYPAAVTTVFNRLSRFSGGDPGRVLSMLENAVQKKWQGIYPDAAAAVPAAGEEAAEWR